MLSARAALFHGPGRPLEFRSLRIPDPGPGEVLVRISLATICGSDLGLYLPYAAVHTTIFERLIALTRERGNVGHLMYVADSVGYLGYLAVMFAKWRWTVDVEFLPQFLVFGGAGALVSLLALLFAALFFARVNRPAVSGLRAAPFGSV